MAKNTNKAVEADSDYPQIVDAYKLGIHNWTHANAKAGNIGNLRRGTATQAVGDKVHLNASPVMDGVPYPGQDPTIGAWVKEDGSSPAVEYRFYLDGVEITGSQKAADLFELGSYEGDGGCTPAVKLKTQAGEGRHFFEVEVYNQPQYNGGVGVTGPRIGWYID